METRTRDELSTLHETGFVLLRGVFSAGAMAAAAAQFEAALRESNATAIRTRQGGVYAARNVLTLLPLAQTLWRCDTLVAFLTRVLGSPFGLVRGLYFDKPPERSWALPWHRDETIAVREHVVGESCFRNPTLKEGVPHVLAPAAILEQMLTLRIHLDPVTPENGPLQVVPGSHTQGHPAEPSPTNFVPVLCDAGDVLAMRPLLLHSSGHSQATKLLHRRVLHLEFAASPTLPDSYAWHTFLPGNPLGNIG